MDYDGISLTNIFPPTKSNCPLNDENNCTHEAALGDIFPPAGSNFQGSRAGRGEREIRERLIQIESLLQTHIERSLEFQERVLALLLSQPLPGVTSLRSHTGIYD